MACEVFFQGTCGGYNLTSCNGRVEFCTQPYVRARYEVVTKVPKPQEVRPLIVPTLNGHPLSDSLLRSPQESQTKLQQTYYGNNPALMPPAA